MFKRIFLICLILIGLFSRTKSKQPDTLLFETNTYLGILNDEKTPFWIRANQNGKFSYGSQLFESKLSYKRNLFKKIPIETGINLLTNLKTGNSVFNEYYLKVNFQKFEFRSGAFQNTLGYTANELSTGSLAISNNTFPIPQLGFVTKEVISLPFMEHYIGFKGGISHRWLEKNRYIKNAYIHEKHLYIHSGNKIPFEFYGGIIHLAIWGGTHPVKGKILSDLNSFIDVFMASDADNSSSLGGEIQNRAGNHLGIFDFGTRFHFFKNKYEAYLYYQIPFEDGSGMRIFKNPDQLLGICISNKNGSLWWKSFLYEYLNTTFQSGLGTPDPVAGQSGYGYSSGGRDDYYNNYLYQTGWTYKNQIIGTPLFLTLDQGNSLLNHNFPDYNDNIINNRVISQHFAFTGKINDALNYKAFLTYTINLGTYTGLHNGRYNWAIIDQDFDQSAYYFYNPKKQTYIGLEFCYTHKPIGKWEIYSSYRFATDVGQLYNAIAVLFNLRLLRIV